MKRTSRIPWARLLGIWALLVGAGAWWSARDVGLAAPSADVVARYVLEAELLPRTRQVRARGTLTWRNPSDTEPVDALWLHLYMNAFRDERSTFLQEASGRRGAPLDPRDAGSIDVTRFVRSGTGSDLLPAATFEAPDDGNAFDRTVLKVPLDRPLGPGEEATFEMSWDVVLPRVRARTGAALGNTFFLVAQWFPKPGVFERTQAADGTSSWQWSCHQFHAHSEFYADWSSFDVTLRAPTAYEGRVGATGQRTGDPQRSDDGTVAVRFTAEPVHDFAWVAGEDFLVKTFRFGGGAGAYPEEQRRVARLLGRLPEDLALSPVEVTLLLQPEHADLESRHRDAIINALSLMGTWFGPYPFPTLTVVDPDHRGRAAGGMEYPTFITGGVGLDPASRELSPEGVLVHEFGHQIFQGLLASNEFEHAWLDEGFTTYATGRVLMAAYPPPVRPARVFGQPWLRRAALPFDGIVGTTRSAVPPLASLFDDKLAISFGKLEPVAKAASWLGSEHPPKKLSLWPPSFPMAPLDFVRDAAPLTHMDLVPLSVAEGERLRDAERPVVDPIAGRKGWEYLDRSSYGVNSYMRTANALRTLERLVGERTMLRILRRYVDRWSFRHPRPEDFFAVAQEVATEDGAGDLGWFFDEVFVRGLPVAYGVDPVESRPAPVAPDSLAPGVEGPMLSRVIVRRHGEARFPVEVVVRFEDGTERRLRWNRDDSLEALDGGPVPPRVAPARGEQQRWVGVNLIGPTAVSLVQVDPSERLALERNRLDDGWRATPRPEAAIHLALRALGQVEMTTTFYGGL